MKKIAGTLGTRAQRSGTSRFRKTIQPLRTHRARIYFFVTNEKYLDGMVLLAELAVEQTSLQYLSRVRSSNTIVLDSDI